MKRHFTSIFSVVFGKFASKEFNSSLQYVINYSYVKLMKLDMSNFEDINSYPTLKALFIRKLKKEPIIDSCITSVISPCDGRVVALGKIEDGLAYQIKGMEYNIYELIGVENRHAFDLLQGGDYINFYLSPKDYHRYHMPFDVKVKSLLYIPGKLYPVNLPLLKRKMNLYLENERVVLEVVDRFERVHYIVLVGALNVGKMVVTFEPRLNTNADNKRVYYCYKEPKILKKGELFGWFEMGSTIVILSQKDAISWSVKVNQKVSYGEVIGELNEY